jgi:hypothetical protein
MNGQFDRSRTLGQQPDSGNMIGTGGESGLNSSDITDHRRPGCATLDEA